MNAVDLNRDPAEPAFLIPIKSFNDAKSRLAEMLSHEARYQLAKAMATTVVSACHSAPVYIVCDDDEVAEWSTSIGATVLWEPADGLNRAVTQGRHRVADIGHDRVVIVHSDLLLVGDLCWLQDFQSNECIIVPDRHRQGTNALAIPSSTDFDFHYGPGSFHMHLAEAAKRNLSVAITEDVAVGFDVDTPDDLQADVLALQQAHEKYVGGPIPEE